jgi:hypothetical protein
MRNYTLNQTLVYQGNLIQVYKHVARVKKYTITLNLKICTKLAI